METIVVTGATSMIGVALIESALQHENVKRIYAVVRSNSKKLHRLPTDERIRIVYSDVSEYGKLPSLIEDTCDVFYHLAWPRTATYVEYYEDIAEKASNIRYVIDAVKAASETGCSKFVGAGSQSEYGLVHGGYKTSSPCFPVRADGVCHLAAAQLAAMAAESFQMECVWVRVFSVYGKYDRNNSMISTTIAKLMHGEKCSFTPCEQQWNYLNAKDAGNAFLLIGEERVGSKVYNLAGRESRPLKEYIEALRDVAAPDAELGIGELPYPNNAVMHMNVDVSDLVRDTGWSQEISFEQGISEIVQHLQGEIKT